MGLHFAFVTKYLQSLNTRKFMSESSQRLSDLYQFAIRS